MEKHEVRRFRGADPARADVLVKLLLRRRARGEADGGLEERGAVLTAERSHVFGGELLAVRKHPPVIAFGRRARLRESEIDRVERRFAENADVAGRRVAVKPGALHGVEPEQKIIFIRLAALWRSIGVKRGAARGLRRPVTPLPARGETEIKAALPVHIEAAVGAAEKGVRIGVRQRRAHLSVERLCVGAHTILVVEQRADAEIAAVAETAARLRQIGGLAAVYQDESEELRVRSGLRRAVVVIEAAVLARAAQRARTRQKSAVRQAQQKVVPAGRVDVEVAPRRLALRVRREEKAQRRDRRHGEPDGPKRGLFVVDRVFDASPHAALPEGERRARDDASAGREPQERGRVVAARLRAERLEHRLVAAHLHVSPAEEKCQPDERMKPVDAQREEKDELHDIVAAPQMGALVEQDVIHFIFRERRRQINFRPEHAQHKRRLHAVAQPDVSPVPHRADELAAQPQKRSEAVEQQRRKAAEPDDLQNEHPDLHGVRARLRRSGGQGGVDRAVERRQAAVDLGYPRVDDVGRHAVRLHPLQTPWTFKRRRTKQPEQHHRPERVGKNLRRFFEREPREQHGADDEARRERHAQNGGKNVVEHITPPCSRQ